MMKNQGKSILIFIVFSALTVLIFNLRFDIEFKYHIYGSDKILANEDYLHPIFAYFRNNKLVGVKIISNPECGRISKHYLLDENEILNKIICKTEFFADHCDSTSL